MLSLSLSPSGLRERVSDVSPRRKKIWVSKSSTPMSFSSSRARQFHPWRMLYIAVGQVRNRVCMYSGNNMHRPRRELNRVVAEDGIWDDTATQCASDTRIRPTPVFVVPPPQSDAHFAPTPTATTFLLKVSSRNAERFFPFSLLQRVTVVELLLYTTV